MTTDGPVKTERYLYVSWGGSGRASCLRQVIHRADAHNASVRYLAILDDSSFDGIDDKMLGVIADELTWLLAAQIDLAQHQTGKDRDVTLQVEAGPVGPTAVAVAKETECTMILVGAPVPVSESQSVAELLAELQAATGVPVELVGP